MKVRCELDQRQWVLCRTGDKDAIGYIRYDLKGLAEHLAKATEEYMAKEEPDTAPSKPVPVNAAPKKRKRKKKPPVEVPVEEPPPVIESKEDGE